MLKESYDEWKERIEKEEIKKEKNRHLFEPGSFPEFLYAMAQSQTTYSKAAAVLGNLIVLLTSTK